MSSSRFPGKMLAPLRGMPLVRHVLDRAALAVGAENVVLCTSTEESDAPLHLYGAALGYAVVRGSLDNTVLRFQQTLAAHPCDAFFRVCGDSPLLDPELLRAAGRLFADGAAILSNGEPKSYPRGHSVELLRSSVYAQIDAAALDAMEREHATRYLLQRPLEFRHDRIRARGPDRSGGDGYAVDSLEDLRRLDALLAGVGYPRAAEPELCD